MTHTELVQRLEALALFEKSVGWQQLKAIIDAREKTALDAALVAKEPFFAAKMLGEMACLRELKDWPHREGMILRQELDNLDSNHLP